MIKQITIQNFQSHKDSTLNLSPGVNLIVGQSDSGKTAILRALKWLATNRPLGDSFVTWDKKGPTEVEVILDNGGKTKLYLKHMQGRYSFAHASDEQEWNAIGAVVPETVTQALNISELSWQSQMDAPFLLSSSPGEVARTLNEVADLDKIDSTLVNINRMARDNRSELMTTAEHKRDLEISLSAFKGLDERLKKITQLKEMNRKAGLLDEMVDEGGNLLEAIEQENIQLAKTKDMTDAEAELNMLMDMVGQVREVEDMIYKMEKQIANIAAAKKWQVEVDGKLEVMEKTWKERFQGKVCPLCGRR